MGCSPNLPSSECSKVFLGGAVSTTVEDGIRELAG